VGLALAAGYVLGRSHKMKWALTLAAMAARGRLPGGAGGLLGQGAKLLSSSPELAKLTEEMRGQLIEAGKAAAVAAVSSKINSLSDDLRDRSDAMRAAGTGGKDGTAAGDEEDIEDERYHRDRAERVPAPRRESGRDRASRPSRSRDRATAEDRERHPSRSGGQGNGEDTEPADSEPRGQGRSRPRSSTSRTGGDANE
jgi:hypothetical protein